MCRMTSRFIFLTINVSIFWIWKRAMALTFRSALMKMSVRRRSALKPYAGLRMPLKKARARDAMKPCAKKARDWSVRKCVTIVKALQRSAMKVGMSIAAIVAAMIKAAAEDAEAVAAAIATRMAATKIGIAASAMRISAIGNLKRNRLSIQPIKLSMKSAICRQNY